MDEILKITIEPYWEVFSCSAVYYPGSNVWVCAWNPKITMTIWMKAIEKYFPVVEGRSVTFKSVDEIL